MDVNSSNTSLQSSCKALKLECDVLTSKYAKCFAELEYLKLRVQTHDNLEERINLLCLMMASKCHVEHELNLEPTQPSEVEHEDRKEVEREENVDCKEVEQELNNDVQHEVQPELNNHDRKEMEQRVYMPQKETKNKINQKTQGDVNDHTDNDDELVSTKTSPTLMLTLIDDKIHSKRNRDVNDSANPTTIKRKKSLQQNKQVKQSILQHKPSVAVLESKLSILCNGQQIEVAFEFFGIILYQKTPNAKLEYCLVAARTNDQLLRGKYYCEFMTRPAQRFTLHFASKDRTSTYQIDDHLYEKKDFEAICKLKHDALSLETIHSFFAKNHRNYAAVYERLKKLLTPQQKNICKKAYYLK